MFNVGDRVECIDCHPESILKIGNIYTVVKIWSNSSGTFVRVEEVDFFNHSYSVTRFKPAPISLENK